MVGFAGAPFVGRLSWRAVASAAVAVVLTASRAVDAEQRPSPVGAPSQPPVLRARLEWDRQATARGCAAAERIERDTESLLGRRLFVASGRLDVTVRVRLAAARPGWVARIELLDRAGVSLGVRELRTAEADCATLDGPAALVIALMLEASRPEAALRLPLPPAGPRAEPPTEPPWRAESQMAVAVSAGLLPGLALGVTANLGVAPPEFVPIVLGLTVWPGVTETTDGRGGRFSAWHAGIALSPPLATGSVAGFGLGLGADAGILSGTGVGLDYAESPSRPLVQGRADARIWVRLGGPFSLRLAVGAAAPLVRPRFVYGGPDGEPVQVYRPWPVVPQASLGLGLDAPP